MKKFPTTQTIIALAFIVFAFYVFRMVLLRDVKATEPIVISIVEAIKNLIFLIAGYYFASSLGSKKKEEALLGKKDETPAP